MGVSRYATLDMRLAWRATLATRALIWAAGIGALLIWGTSGREHDFDPFGLTRPFAAFGDLIFVPAARWRGAAAIAALVAAGSLAAISSPSSPLAATLTR